MIYYRAQRTLHRKAPGLQAPIFFLHAGWGQNKIAFSADKTAFGPLELCLNCRTCVQQEGVLRGASVIADDMQAVLEQIEPADALVLRSTMNFSTVTAVMKRFFDTNERSAACSPPQPMQAALYFATMQVRCAI